MFGLIVNLFVLKIENKRRKNKNFNKWGLNSKGPFHGKRV